MQNAAEIINTARAKAYAPRQHLTVSEWSDKNRILSGKGSSEPGPWRTSRNPPLKEPMDCLSARSSVQNVVLMWPIQFGKSEVACNFLGYTMEHNPGPTMVCLPGEVSLQKWVNQKLNPLIDETPSVKETLTSVASRDSSNTRTFKDFLGGQLYMEHAGSPQRLKQTSVKTLTVDELDEFAASLTGGDDPVDMLLGRTSAFPSGSKHLFISTPQIRGISRIEQLWHKSDQRKYHVPCPHCGEMQPLEWAGLKWDKDTRFVAYACRECGALIDEHHKTEMIANGQWIPEHPGRKIRGYQINCLYYQIGLGPRWSDLVEQWLEAQNDPARLKTFINDRLAEPYDDPMMRKLRDNVIAERAEQYPLRRAPLSVGVITAGVDTQDDRLEVQIIGWGKKMAAWTLDYVVLTGDPADDAVWVQLTDLLNRPIEREDGAMLPILATAIDGGGHRTEAVKHYVRSKHIKRPMVTFGAVSNTAPVLSKPKPQDVNWRGRTDKRGVHIHHVGTVAIKQVLFGRLATDGDKKPEKRLIHLSEDLPPEYFNGLVSETYDPRKNRFVARRGVRNEPLDTWVYAYAAAHHQELRLHLFTQARWDELVGRTDTDCDQQSIADPIIDIPKAKKSDKTKTNTPAPNPFASASWLNDLYDL